METIHKKKDTFAHTDTIRKLTHMTPEQWTMCFSWQSSPADMPGPNRYDFELYVRMETSAQIGRNFRSPRLYFRSSTPAFRQDSPYYSTDTGNCH